MKYSEQDQLLQGILDGDELSEFRRASLETMLTTVRRRTRRRQAVRMCVWVGLSLLAVMGVLRAGKSSLPGQNSVVLVAPAPAPSARGAEKVFINDEELLALFPNRSVALIGKPGEQQLVFLDRPRDAGQKPLPN